MSKTRLVEGLYDLVVDEELRAQLADSSLREEHGELDAEGLSELLTQQLVVPLRKAFRAVAKRDGTEAATRLANSVVSHLVDETESMRAGIENSDQFVVPPERLVALYSHNGTLGADGPPIRPGLRLTESDLLVNGRQELRIGPEIRKELESADRVDLLCAFLRFSGIKVIRDELQRFLARRPKGLRILTTTYMGATENRAVRELLEMGADLRISYNNQTTRLHAKAWLFHRESGFSTAFIGSSNLSYAALYDGLEWNVRVSSTDNPAILARFETTFEQYWHDVEFEPYDEEAFKQAYKKQADRAGEAYISGLKLRPFPHQSEILDELESERSQGHTRNLVVSATGTGKTVTAALDFKRLYDAHYDTEGPLTLLFVAHRREILKQSRATFRAAMSDPSFGELLVGGERPNFGDHVFASVQSLHSDRLEDLSPDAYDVVVVDEFHHAAAPTYDRLLEHLEPRYLLGLTATPERADGKSILQWFDHRVASEIRLWKALDRGLLAPFAYFGVGDETDLSGVKFRRGTYDRTQLQQLLTGDNMRAMRIRQAVHRYVTDPMSMRALGFCVGLGHAELMARSFNEAGIAACAVAGDPPRENGEIRAPFIDRDDALRKLRDGQIQCVFTVDLFNEGVDVPRVDTVLFLRPTDSATIFLQQLGRGLRHAPGKSHLTVLDFIGQANRKYRFDLKFRALTGGSRRDLVRQVEQGFPALPPGCEIKLDRTAQEHVLDNIKASIGSSELRFVTEELRDAATQFGPDVSLEQFLDYADLEVDDLYSRVGRSWTDYRRRADLPWPASDSSYESALLKSMARVQHVDDRERLTRWFEWLGADSPPELASPDSAEGRLQLMFLAGIVDRNVDLSARREAFEQVWQTPAIRAELRQLFGVLLDRNRRVTHRHELADGVPLHVHGTYSLGEIMAGYGVVKNGSVYAPREGVYWHEPTRTDLFFITLNKSEDDYSPRTLYDDYPMSQQLFHWESQAGTSESSPTGQRYIKHESRGTNVVLFVRQYKKLAGLTQPYLCLGRARYVRHESERPMRMVWELERPMPAAFYQDAKTAAG